MKRRSFTLLWATCALACVASADDWLTFGGDSRRSGYAAGETALDKDNVGKLKLEWSTKLPNVAKELNALTVPVIIINQPTARSFKDFVFVAGSSEKVWSIDAETGKVLWEFQTDASKENKGWVLTAERRFNVPMLFFDNWREGPLVAQDRQLSVGSIFSSPLVANGTVYFGSTDGFLYAID